VEMTKRLVEAVAEKYSVNTKQIYGTGQSMGGMTVLYLAATYPKLFAAELFVSCQWDITVLGNLVKEKFCYYAAAGDQNASGGQSDVQAMLEDDGKSYQTTTDLDATADASEQNATVQKMLAKGSAYNFVNFKEGTVLEVSDADSSDPMASSEHMASFEPAYKIAASRDWLFQHKG
ncbi:alpha/beta hydrolase-fold protein, partial [Streptomyces sp. TRM76130]|nr:alpha/beta hydrolase-fold protein [Streptomyces sp. TRM76130]